LNNRTIKTKLILLLLISGSTLIPGNVRAQQLVFDPAVVSTLVVNHTAQQSALKDIKNSESEIAAAQKVIAVQMSYIRELEQKMYNSLRNVSMVITGAKDIVYASQIAKDIGAYQKQMVEIATGDPILMVVALKTEAALIQRTADLFTYIYTVAFVGGDINLMNNKARLDIIKHVVRELRIMRGMAYGIVRKMRVAKYAGVMKTLNPFGLNYPNNSRAIAQSLLNELKQ
jgi:hypothetical protein